MKRPLEELNHAEQMAFDSPEQNVYVSLLRTADELESEFAKLFKSFDLSPPQYNVLRILRGAGEKGLPTQKISERLITRVPDVTRLVDRLVTAELVTRRRCEEDRRVVYVVLTNEGRARLAELDDPVDALHREQLGHLPQDKLVSLIRLLEAALHKP